MTRGGDYEGLSPADELELRRRREKEAAPFKAFGDLVREQVRLARAAEDPVTLERIESVRAALKAAGRPHGDGSIAKVLNTSKSTIRRRQGKIT